MKVSDFDYYLPEKLIAQHPIPERDQSRLLVYDKKERQLNHRVFSDVLDYLRPDDCLVINDTKVIPARLHGYRKDTGGKVEILLLESKEQDIWEALVKPGKRARIGMELSFGEGLLRAKIIDILEGGSRLLKLDYKGVLEEILDKVGTMPLPPYIHERLEEGDRYQTVYNCHAGSSAAPTAGLHFTERLLSDIEKKGIKIARITLHVGLGTFRPVQVEDIKQHRMHFETYAVSMEAAQKINDCRNRGGRIIAVGTTSTRTLESIADDKGLIQAGFGRTDIFIYPGYKFKSIDGLITNFHLPKSTLIMLVGAFIGREETLDIYQKAVEEKYRFFSFGDAMLIL